MALRTRGPDPRTRPGEPRLRSVLVALSLLLATVMLTVPASSADPEPWTIPPVHVGDQVTYSGIFNDTKTHTVLNETLETRDAFGRLREAVMVEDSFTISGNERTAYRAIDARTGVFIWLGSAFEEPDDQAGREYRQTTTGMLGGALSLAGRTMTPGESIEIPHWTGRSTKLVTFSVGDPITVDGRERLPVSPDFMADTIWFERGSPWPVSVEYINVEETRLEHSRGDDVALTVLEEPWPPWEKNPHMTFREPPPYGPVVEDVPGAYYNVPERLHEAITFAEENAEGLQGFMEDHHPTTLRETWMTLEREWARFPVPGTDLAYLNRTAQVFELTFQALETGDQWYVEVIVSKAFVLGVEVSEEWTFEEDAREGGSPFTADPLFEGTHVEYSTWASLAHMEMGDWEFARYIVQTNNWGDAKLSYMYKSGCGGSICVNNLTWIQMHSSSGALTGTMGEPTGAVLHDFDEKGPWKVLSE